MWVIIAGSRGISGVDIVQEAVNNSGFKNEIEGVVCGMAKGVDMSGYEWAIKNKKKVEIFPANWDKHGKRAGYLRNVEMGEFGDALIAIWDGTSRGTAMMIDIMERKRKAIYIHKMYGQGED